MTFLYVGDHIVGLLPQVTWQTKFLLVVTYYFTKWREVEPYAQIKVSLLNQLRVLHAIVLDNGPQFISKSFQQFFFFLEFGIKNVYSTPRYPSTNGQAEVINKTLLNYIQKRLTSAKGKWVDELAIILWGYHKTLKQPTRETPYALAFGNEALIPVKFGLDLLHTSKPPTFVMRWMS